MATVDMATTGAVHTPVLLPKEPEGARRRYHRIRAVRLREGVSLGIARGKWGPTFAACGCKSRSRRICG